MRRFLAPLLSVAGGFGCASQLQNPPNSAVADVEIKHCFGPQIRKIYLPVNPKLSNSRQFPYRFKYSDDGDLNKPVIIFLPGGPGYTSMDHAPKSLPAGYPIVTTDQRGTGCNALPDSDVPLESVSSENMAEDVVAAIKELGLGNYIVYGHSFGTVHATKVVARIEDRIRKGEAIASPKALVLEGVLGKAFPSGSWIKSYQTQWDMVRSGLTKEVSDVITAEAPPFANLIPTQKAASNWAKYISSMLYWGAFPESNGIGDLRFSLGALADSSESETLMRLRASVIASKYVGYFPLFLQVTCSELDEEFYGELLLVKGKLVRGDEALCSGRKLTSPYDAVDLQIQAPITYFQGDADPAAPLWQAEYHFNSQKQSSNRTFVHIRSVGHEPLQGPLSYCRQELWQSIAEGNRTTGKILKSCPGVKDVRQESTSTNAHIFNLKY